MAKVAMKTNKPRQKTETEQRPDFATAKPVERPQRTRRFTLRLLREALGKTQAEVAEIAGMSQSDLSKLEARDDVKLSTLHRYLQALDATIEVAAVLKSGRKFRLNVGQNLE